MRSVRVGFGFFPSLSGVLYLSVLPSDLFHLAGAHYLLCLFVTFSYSLPITRLMYSIKEMANICSCLRNSLRIRNSNSHLVRLSPDSKQSCCPRKQVCPCTSGILKSISAFDLIRSQCDLGQGFCFMSAVFIFLGYFFVLYKVVVWPALSQDYLPLR